MNMTFKLSAPLIITSRLGPGVFVGDDTLTVTPTADEGGGRYTFGFSIDTFSGTLATGDGLSVYLARGESLETDLPRKAVAALLDFLAATAEEHVAEGTIDMGTTKPEILWAHRHQADIESLTAVLSPPEECRHSWVAGIMYVHDEDLDAVYAARQEFGGTIDCEKCEKVYTPTANA
jgi:hypothetical protein